MSKHTSVFTILLLLFFTLSSAARHEPTFVTDSAVKFQYEEVEAEKSMEVVGGSCEGAADKDECLMRRTLAAHTDYIYTQKQKP
ncbi:hypothetical protein VitviT2T_027423 [Vitis vinifera]|uniref:Phytosulfokine n=2 Tax=Vitis vinifera TaxID=29760 RepID=A0ABY9DRY8_VITVI|eukprot:XP_002285430.1 PREDICTED: phytosulfokines 3 [Vitis vinifera]